MPRRWWRTWARRWSEVLPGAQGTRGGASRSLRSHLHVIADRKSTRLNSSHLVISYAVFCLKKKKQCTHPHAHINHILDLLHLHYQPLTTFTDTLSHSSACHHLCAPIPHHLHYVLSTRTRPL